MERDFNNRAGFTSKDDTLPPRLLNEPAKTGPAKGLVNKLPEMLPKYYAARAGTPTASQARHPRAWGCDPGGLPLSPAAGLTARRFSERLAFFEET
jgi:hypothetical protein